MKLGYHYTSWEAWHKIQTEGLIPYEIDKPDIRHWFNSPIQGIWLWPEMQRGLKHCGEILCRFSKGRLEIVLLAVSYIDSDCYGLMDIPQKNLRKGDVFAGFFHNGEIGQVVYHEREPAIILRQKVESTRIRFIQSWNLIELLEPNVGELTIKPHYFDMTTCCIPEDWPICP